MGIDFDESGTNEEYGASADEPTGELDAQGRPKPARRTAAQPIEVTPAPKLHGNVNDLVSAIMGTTGANPVQQPQTAEEAQDATESEYMNDVEERLDVAAHFRNLLAHPLFDNNTKAANIVTFEVHGFIRQRLGELLGIGSTTKKEETFTPPQVDILRALATLTPDHVAALKIVAARLTGEQPSKPAPAQREAPVHRPAPAPVTPASTPAPAPSGPRRAAPAPAPAGAAPASTPPQAAPTAQNKPRGPGRPLGSKNRPKATEAMVQAVRKHQDGSEEPLFNEDGTPYMVKVPRIQRPAGAMPFPNETQMGQVTAAQAAGRAQVLESNPNVVAALTGLKNPV